MGISVFPEPSAASKTMRRTVLTSGTTFTVPATVTFVNVTLFGGGGGGGGCGLASPGSSAGGAGGTTTFTGATSATGGNGGERSFADTGGNTTVHCVAVGTEGKTNTGQEGLGGSCNSATRGYQKAGNGTAGQVISSTLTTTPGGTINYAIGGGGSGGAESNSAGTGGAGGSGFIIVEYWI